MKTQYVSCSHVPMETWVKFFLIFLSSAFSRRLGSEDRRRSWVMLVLEGPVPAGSKSTNW